MKLLLFTATLFISIMAISQNNYIVQTEDGRRVLLKSDYTWEYIDLQPTSETNKEEKITEAINLPLPTNGCNLNNSFTEPSLNLKIQALLKRNRSDISSLKKKVAKKEKCDVNSIKLLSAKETKAKGYYTFCTCNGKIQYKRNGSAFFRKGKLF